MILEAGLEAVTQVLVLPARYRQRLRTTNMYERLNEQLRRRERVIRTFPHAASAVRLIGALLGKQHEHWITGKLYFDMEPQGSWKAETALLSKPETSS